MRAADRRGVVRFSLRTGAAACCAVAIFLSATTEPPDHQAGHAVETPFLVLELHTTVQCRRQHASPGDVLLRGLFVELLSLLAVAIATDLELRWALVVVAADLHLRVFPQMRRQALVVFDCLDDLREAIGAINRLHRAVLFSLVLLAVLPGEWRDSPSSSPVLLVGVALIDRPRTLHPDNLTSAARDGVVDHYRIRTAHTDTHWVLELRQPLTLRIPRSDPDLADVVMVILYEGTGPDGRHYLDQAKIGRIFRLSRQMTHIRIGLYQRRERIEDVLSRERHNHALTPPVVAAIHEMLLEDPFVGASEIRRRLADRGLIAGLGDISLDRVSRAMQAVDYLAVRQRLQELMRRGELVPDYQKLCQILLREMAALAEAAGKKIGQHIIPVAQLIDPLAGQAGEGRSIPGRPAGPMADELLGPPMGQDDSVPPGHRTSFVWYFTFGASYREIAVFLGVCASTVYRRLAWIRQHLPPLQQILGVVLFSGVVGVDEKYILVPKPHREGKMARWGYLFVAIDPYTYDLLHAEVYPARTADCARAFLLSLKAQGVRTPRVIVTDLWGPYETVVPEVYPGATHHQCVFHAEQATSTLMRDKLGKGFRSVPAAETLRKAIVHVFRAGCRRTLIRRYGNLLKQKETLVASCPELTSVFDSLARHFEKVSNAYADRRVSIPRTNNAVETVIRTFTRRYKAMAGFERLETARAYVRLWAYYYRLRPFSPDAQRRIRNRSPLQIAGYAAEVLACLELVMPPPPLQARA